MRYSAAFNFHRRPPVEILVPADAIGTMPGQVAFSFLRVDCQDAGSIGTFLEKFRATGLYIGGRRIDAATAGAFLLLEQAAMQDFVKTVLLIPPPEWYLTDVPPSNRVAVFFHRHRQRGRLERYFRDISLRPAVHLKPEKVERALTKEGRLAEKAAKLQERSLTVLPKWEVLLWRYETDNLLAVAWLELFLIAEHNLVVKECQKCKGYFVPWPANALYCSECRRDTSRQALYWANRAGEMTEEERAARKEYYRTHKRLVRRIKRLHKEGKSVREIAEEVGRTQEWVRDRLAGRRGSP